MGNPNAVKLRRDNPVRLMDLLVDKVFCCHAEKFSFKGQSALGCTAYNPCDLLKLYLYGYLHRISSSRRLEAETYRNLEVKWLLCDLYDGTKVKACASKESQLSIQTIQKKLSKAEKELEDYLRLLTENDKSDDQ